MDMDFDKTHEICLDDFQKQLLTESINYNVALYDGLFKWFLNSNLDDQEPLDICANSLIKFRALLDKINSATATVYTKNELNLLIECISEYYNKFPFLCDNLDDICYLNQLKKIYFKIIPSRLNYLKFKTEKILTKINAPDLDEILIKIKINIRRDKNEI